LVTFMDGLMMRNVSEREVREVKRLLNKGLEKFLVEMKIQAKKYVHEEMLKIIFGKKQKSSGGARSRAAALDTVNAIVLVIKPKEVLVYIENVKDPVNLGRSWMLVALLLCLCDKEHGRQVGADELVPAKSPDQLIGLINDRFDKQINRATLRMHVLRLRNLLEKAGLKRELVESINGGYRFRLGAQGQVIIRTEES
jgi:hypothetical protein